MIKKLSACEKIIKLSKKWYEQKRFYLQPKRYNKVQSANESQLPEEGPLFETRILLYRLSSELSDCRLLILLLATQAKPYNINPILTSLNIQNRPWG